MPTIRQRLAAAYQGFMTGGSLTQKNAAHRGYDTHDARLLRYAERYANYSGLLTRDSNRLLSRTQWKPIRYNFFRPQCSFAAGWAVGPTVKWVVTGESDAQTFELSKRAQDIWNRSEGDSEFLLAALTGAIYGDMVCSVARRDGIIYIEFPDPCICFPTFEPGDISRLKGMRVCYGEGDDEVEEIWEDGQYRSSGGTESIISEVPFVWLPNMAIKGQAYGDSEIDPIYGLVAEYDHLAVKESRIMDRYSGPTIVAKGVAKGTAEIEKNVETIFYLPNAESSLEYLEWKGSRPDVKEQFDRIRTAMSEIGETPPIAFGQIDSGFSGASGISLKVLYGPANGKAKRKRSLWGPRIERMMALAMAEDGVPVQQEQISIGWEDATPESRGEILDGLEAEKRLGATAEAVLKKAGYSPEEAKQMVAEGEAAAEKAAERQARTYSRGSVVP